jgi:cell division protein FtsB
VNDKRPQGHGQKRTVTRSTPTRPAQTTTPSRSPTRATPRARLHAPSRAHMSPSVGRTRRHLQKVQSQKPGPLKAETRMQRRRAIRRRRARIIWVVCGAFCLVVLATSFPAQALLRQREAISSTTSELDRLNAGDQALQRQADELANPANIAALARSDYNMVSPGEKAYQVLPTADSPEAKSLASGHSALDQGPVAPGSAESQALLGDAGSETNSGSHPGTGASGDQASSPASVVQHRAPGLWGRVLNTLEFWR